MESLLTASPATSDVSSYPTVINFNSTSKDFSREHNISVVLGSLMMFCGSYLLASLIFFECQTNAMKRMVVRSRSSRKSTVRKTFRTKLRVGKWTQWLCLIAASLAFSRYIIEMFEIFEKEIAPSPCSWVRQIKAILHCGAVTCIYLVLWLRQRQFYQMQALKYLCGKTTRFISRAVIVVMIIANLVTIIFYLATRGYDSSERGCTLSWSKIWTKLPGILYFFFTTLFQVMLVGLLIHPLYQHRTTSFLSTRNKQMKLIKRVCVSAVFATITTAVTSILSLTILRGNYGALRQIIFDVDIFVSLLSIIISFKDWKARMFPCLAKKRIELETELRGSERIAEVDGRNTSVKAGGQNPPMEMDKFIADSICIS